MKKTIVIFDLDNCVANDAHRIPLIDWKQQNLELRYAAYHAACEQDEPCNLALFRRVADVNHICFFTARPVAVYEKTIVWIRERLGCKDFTLHMRNNGDHRHSLALKTEMLGHLLHDQATPLECIIGAYDDRPDIVEMYRLTGIDARVLAAHDVCAYTPPTTHKTAADILGEMADTYRARNAVYGDNFRRVGPVMQALHPNGVTQKSAQDHELFHLWSLLIVKASRFAVSELTHQDSMHDLCVYGAMIESILQERQATK